MSQKEIDILKRALHREKLARKAAESILEEKSRVLFDTSQKLEGLLLEKSTQLEGIFETIADAYVVMDIQGNILKFNDAATELFGHDITKKKLNTKDLIYTEDLEYAINSFWELKTNGYFKDYEARVYTKSKEVKWVHINASAIFDKDKNPIAAQGIVRDITQAKESEKRLIESEKRLSTLILNLDSAILLEDEHRKIAVTNKQFCELFKIPVAPELMTGQDCTNAAEQSKTLFSDPEGFVNKINEILSQKVMVLGDELKMKDGKILERDYIPIFTKNEYKGHLWSYKDVTLSKNYARSLEAQKQKYSSIIANMNLGLIEVDTEDKILMVNQRFLEMSGYSDTELIGKIASNIFTNEKGSLIIQNEHAKREKGNSNSYELEIRNKQGELKYWLISGAPNYNLNGEFVGTIGIHLDITDIKNLEQQKEKLLLKLEKSNNELEEYAHIVSHDLKSPLHSIDALLSWIKEDNMGKFDETTLQNIEHIEMTLEKMEQLIFEILNYSSVTADNSEMTEVDTDNLLHELAQILHIPEHIELKIPSNLPIVKADKTKIQQVFQNLISNAVKFSNKSKGLIEIAFQDDSEYYQFSIRDNGIGIEKKYHEKIFKIFNTLNKSKNSTGIGLSIVEKIIRLHGGEIWLESELNIGSTFFFTLKKELHGKS